MQPVQTGLDDQRSSPTWKEVTSAVGITTMSVHVRKLGYSRKDNCSFLRLPILLLSRRFSVKILPLEDHRTFLIYLYLVY